MNLPAPAHAILHALLDRHEQPGRQNVVRVRLSQREHPAYFSADDVTPRQATNIALRHLADAGALRLHWQRWEENNWLEAVDLVAEQAHMLYTLLGRSPRDEQDHALLQLLDAQEPCSDWHASFLAWTHAQLAAQRSVAPLDRNDPALNGDLLQALTAIAMLPDPVLERTLSVRLFGDSKRLETLRGAIVRVLRRHDPDAALFGDDDWALLQAHQLARAPEYVPIAGPLVLRVQTPNAQQAITEIDLTFFHPSVALSSAMLTHAEVGACSARALMTVENATSFHEMLTVRPPDVLVIYTGGFASPTLIRLLRAVRAARPDLPLLHWGDLDAGGLRILAHLREHAGTVAPLAMNVAIFDAFRAYAQPLTPTDRTALAALRAHPALTDCQSLIDALLTAGKKLEQEAVDSRSVLQHMRSVCAIEP
jgi:hypothetical protein